MSWYSFWLAWCDESARREKVLWCLAWSSIEIRPSRLDDLRFLAGPRILWLLFWLSGLGWYRPVYWFLTTLRLGFLLQAEGIFDLVVLHEGGLTWASRSLILVFLGIYLAPSGLAPWFGRVGRKSEGRVARGFFAGAMYMMLGCKAFKVGSGALKGLVLFFESCVRC